MPSSTPHTHGPIRPGVRTGWPHGVIAAAFVLVTAGTGLVDLVWMVPAPRLMGREAASEVRRAHAARLLDGTLARHAERQLFIRSRVRRVVLPPWATVLYGLGGRTWRWVIKGEEGWIFLAERETAVKGEPAVVAGGPGAVVSLMSRRLMALGARLHLLPVPEKGMVRPDLLPPGRVGRPDLYEAFVRDLGDRGVSAIDLLHAWASSPGAPVFQRTDTHWSDAGALLAAEAVARATGTLVPEAERSTRLVSGPTRWDAGDCLRTCGIDTEALRRGGWARAWLRACGRLHEIGTLEVRGSGGELLDDEALEPLSGADVLVVGTSFSAAVGFPRLLAHLTNRRVRVQPVAGGGPLGSIRRAFDLGIGRLFPRAVVWEFPVYEVFNRSAVLTGAEALIGRLPAPQLRPPPREWLDEPWSGRGTLTVGAHELGTDPLAAWTRPGQMVHGGDGSLCARLTGSVSGGPVTVTSRCGRWQRELTWPADADSVVVPLLARDLTHDTRLEVRAAMGSARLELKSLELLWDLDGSSPLELQPGPVDSLPGHTWSQELAFSSPPRGPGSVCVIKLDLGEGWRGSLEVRGRRGVGASRSLGTVGGLSRTATLIIGVGQAEPFEGLVLLGKGNPPPVVTLRAGLFQLRRAR